MERCTNNAHPALKKALLLSPWPFSRAKNPKAIATGTAAKVRGEKWYKRALAALESHAFLLPG